MSLRHVDKSLLHNLLSQFPVLLFLHGGRLQHWGADGKLVRYPAVPSVPSLQQWFIDCVLGRAENPAPPIWGLRQALLMEALYESAKMGRPVKVQPE